MAFMIGRIDFPSSERAYSTLGRDLGINSTGDDPVGLHRAQAVRQHLLADSLQVFFPFIEPPRTAPAGFCMISSFHLLPIIWTVVATGQAWSSSLVNRYSTSFRMLHSCYSAAFNNNQEEGVKSIKSSNFFSTRNCPQTRKSHKKVTE